MNGILMLIRRPGRPKATLFATEGIHQIDDKLLGNNAHGFAKMSPLALAAESLETMQVIKIELVFVSAQLAIMRSEFAEAKRVRAQALPTWRPY